MILLRQMTWDMKSSEKEMAAISNNEIKRVRSLQQKKFRDEYGLFTVEGEKMVEEAEASGFRIESVYRRIEIGEDAMKKISALSSPSPALAVIHKPSDIYADDVVHLADRYSGRGLFLALDSIRDPGNLGTIMSITGLTSAGASLFVDKLVNAGVLKREEDPNDRRNIIISVTAQGQSFLQEIDDRLDDFICKYFAECSAEELQIIDKTMRIVCSKLDS